MKATEQYSNVVLLIILYKVVLTFEYENGNILTVTIQIKATEQYFPVVQGHNCMFLWCTREWVQEEDRHSWKIPKWVIHKEVIFEFI